MIDPKNINRLRILDSVLIPDNYIPQRKGQTTSLPALFRRLMDNYLNTDCCAGQDPAFCNAVVACGGGGIVEMKYKNLLAAILSSSLIPGQQILLTDYRTSHYIQYSGPGPTGVGGESIHLGPVEPLLLTVISNNQLAKEARSALHPEDTIYYVADLPNKDFDYAAISGKGLIIYRESSALKTARDFDWRNVVFRRWETSVGSGNFWAVKPVAGAAFVDVTTYQNVGGVYNVTIKSPTGGDPNFDNYWNDNTVFDTNFVSIVNIQQGFGNTFSRFTPSGGFMFEFNSNQVAYNTVVSDNIYLNSFADFTNNSIIALSDQDGLAANVVGGCSQNIAKSLSGNQVQGIDGNNCGVNGVITSNYGGRIVDNQVETISDNMVHSIDTNAGVTIASSLISGNVGSVINNNSGISVIQNNQVSSIFQNVVAVIGGNAGFAITFNNGPNDISANTVQSISSNHNTGAITQNVADYIHDNDANVFDISGNVCNEISGNANGGKITNNTFGDSIVFNTGSGDIDSVSGIQFRSVTLAGDVFQSSNVNFNTVNITDDVINTTFNGLITNKTLTPTASISGLGPSIVKYDNGLMEFVEEILTGGVVTYSLPVTS